MPKVHIVIEDMEDGSVGLQCISNRPIPSEVSLWSAAELFAKQVAGAIDTLWEEQFNKGSQKTPETREALPVVESP